MSGSLLIKFKILLNFTKIFQVLQAFNFFVKCALILVVIDPGIFLLIELTKFTDAEGNAVVY